MLKVKLGDSVWQVRRSDDPDDTAHIAVVTARVIAFDDATLCVDEFSGFHGSVLRFYPRTGSDWLLNEEEAIKAAHQLIKQLGAEGKAVKAPNLKDAS